MQHLDYSFSILYNNKRGDYMKLVSWNVNGIRACLSKGFLEYFNQVNADIFCIQESKMQEGQANIDTQQYYQYFNSANKKGYSGVIVFSKKKPLSVHKHMHLDEHNDEGRMLTLEYDNFYLVNVYTPNSKENLVRLPYRMKWEDDFREYLDSLKIKKPVIVCGDFNVAVEEIDLKNPKLNRKNPGFSDEEREKMRILLRNGWIDTFRYLYPDKKDMYSWWSYRFNARANNAGWRIDYFLVSEDLKEFIIDATIEKEVYGSDHCPITLEINI